MCVKIEKDGSLIVKAPFVCPESKIRDFLLKKQDIILRKVELILKQRSKIEEEGYFSQEELAEIKRRAKKVIPKRVAFYAEQSGISYNKIFYRIQKTRWGSCSSKGNLNFNCLLVLMPPEVLDSVVVHELCHRRQMNHSKAFYEEVFFLFPEYKKWNKWLKENGDSFLARIKWRCT